MGRGSCEFARKGFIGMLWSNDVMHKLLKVQQMFKFHLSFPSATL